jgi:hypothetical protein
MSLEALKNFMERGVIDGDGLAFFDKVNQHKDQIEHKNGLSENNSEWSKTKQKVMTEGTVSVASPSIPQIKPVSDDAISALLSGNKKKINEIRIESSKPILKENSNVNNVYDDVDILDKYNNKKNIPQTPIDNNLTKDEIRDIILKEALSNKRLSDIINEIIEEKFEEKFEQHLKKYLAKIKSKK